MAKFAAARKAAQNASQRPGKASYDMKKYT